MQQLPPQIQKTLQERKTQKKTHRNQKNPQQLLPLHSNQHMGHKNKKTKKTTAYIGTITQNGTYKPKQPKKREQSTATYYEYANSQLCQTLSKDIQTTLPNIKYKNGELSPIERLMALC